MMNQNARTISRTLVLALTLALGTSLVSVPVAEAKKEVRVSKKSLDKRWHRVLADVGRRDPVMAEMLTEAFQDTRVALAKCRKASGAKARRTCRSSALNAFDQWLRVKFTPAFDARMSPKNASGKKGKAAGAQKNKKKAGKKAKRKAEKKANER